LDALTSLRFFAALAVVFYHSGAGFAASSRIAPTIVENILNNGWLGVPFFFILSGFILTYAHADMRFDQVQLGRFFVARFSRLYPVYILALLICIPFVDHFSFATDWFQFFLLQTWFPNSGATDWNFVAWTLSVELLFYVVFPFAFVFFRRLSTPLLLGGLCVAIGLLLLIWLNMTPRLGDGEVEAFGFVFHIPVPFLRLPEFVYGMILGTLFLRNKFMHSNLTPYVASFIIVIASGSSTYPAIQTVVLLAFGPLIISLAAASKGNVIRKCLENRILVILGGSSYTLYLLQFPMRKYIALWVPEHLAIYARLVFAPALICISVFVFFCYEGPMRKLLRRAFERVAKT
jgi:peptidoglycan/LPS O-acetylase OafA/YrhL